MEPPNRDFTTTGDFRRARGVIPWQPGDEPAETTIRRLRDAPERAELAEAALAERDKPCVWRLDANASDYITGCDGDWFDVAFGDCKFCPNCGHPILVAPSDNDLLSPDQEGA